MSVTIGYCAGKEHHLQINDGRATIKVWFIIFPRVGGVALSSPAQYCCYCVCNVSQCILCSAANRLIGEVVQSQITEKGHTRAFSWLKAATTACTFKTGVDPTVSRREIGSATQLS